MKRVGDPDRLGHFWATMVSMKSAPSALTCVIWAHRSGPRRSKNSAPVALLRPGAAQTGRRWSWSTTTIRYLWPFLQLISSIPMRSGPANRSRCASASAQTRAMIEPTVRQAIRINSVTIDFEDWVASHAT